MAINPAFTTVVKAGTPYYRITSSTFRTRDSKKHKIVVNGQGALKNPNGGRYDYGMAITVYLTDTIEACLAEKMFYFQRETVRSLDAMHLINSVVPPFQQQFVLWEVVFQNDIVQVCELSEANAPGLHVIPSLMVNPSQDYKHLKQRRNDIQALGYNGIKAPSSRSKQGGRLIVLFQDQSKNLKDITPFDADFRLIQRHPPGGPFTNHATQMLDFFAGHVQISGTPSGKTTYGAFAPVPFHH
jgi:RES domain-containing protein